ncbi:MAG: hypothetical protein K2G03_06960 [Bacilli bacterium]|nr:hypothetical protein [Bacilli bacterium]
MDKYSTNNEIVGSRTQKNKALYEESHSGDLTNFDVNSNESVIGESKNRIDVSEVQKIISERYNLDAPKRKSIDIPSIEEPIVQDTLQNTKEYDINAILAKAKQGKNVDYNKERLKKVRDAQIEILSSLDLELKKVEDPKTPHQKMAEENLMELINTITQIEIKNKKEYSKETSEALDLLSDLKDENDDETTEAASINDEDNTTEEYTEEYTDEYTNEYTEEVTEDITTEHDKTTRVLSTVEMEAYDEFSDVSKQDTGSFVLKIFIFILIIALIVGGVYILDQILALGLFK